MKFKNNNYHQIKKIVIIHPNLIRINKTKIITLIIINKTIN